jgi:hypothetical protein
LEERKEVYNETPLADKKEDAYYYGSQILKAAYIMERIPQLRPVAHPIEQEFHALIHENWLFYARHQYTSFWDYWPEWQKAKKKQQVRLFDNVNTHRQQKRNLLERLLMYGYQTNLH